MSNHTMTRLPLPIFPRPGSRVRVPAEGGGYVRTWTMGEARDDGGRIVIKCVGAGDVLVQKVRACE
jgi:hypothetical protein